MTVTVVIGRFSGFHDGHRYLIQTAVDIGKSTIVLVGSANRPRTIKNPWTWQERAKEIKKEFPDVIIAPLNDYSYNDEHWIADVTLTVDTLLDRNGYKEGTRVTLVGYEKEGTQYLRWFPNWRYHRIEESIAPQVSATILRRWMFENTPEVFTPEVLDDWRYFSNERDKFANYPFPQTLNFSCADAVVECSGNILLIQRKSAPGRNTWALPGGFKNANETFLDCAIRELVEETNLRVPEKVLRGSIVAKKLYDSPSRGCGIPRITQAIYISITQNRDGGLPRANGMDDAKAAMWVPLHSVLNQYQLFDDHQDIISDLINTKASPALFNPLLSKNLD